MILAILAWVLAGLVLAVILWQLTAPDPTGARARSRELLAIEDPALARRAEQSARRLLRAGVGVEEWEMYSELGLLRVWGRNPAGPVQSGTRATRAGASYAYLIYPDGPVISFLPQTRELLGELTLAARRGDHGQGRPAPTADVLAKWTMLTADEDGAVGAASFHLPGRQSDPERVRRDLWRLRQWEQMRMRRLERERRLPAS